MRTLSRKRLGRALLTVTILCCAAPSFGQQKSTGEGGANTLQNAVQNPAASLISVPLQNNTNFDIGPFDRTQNVLNIQPVIPVRISENWNVIMHWITPVIWQHAPGTADLEVFGIEQNTPAFFLAQDLQKNVGVFGFGDMVPTFFFSPAKPAKLIWGLGPVFTLPTATSTVLGQGKLSLGPSAVVLLYIAYAVLILWLANCCFGHNSLGFRRPATIL